MTHLYDAHFQAEDENGEPLAGALLYFYVTGTTTPITVYQDAGKAVSHTNPVVADSAGRFAPIWVDTNGYKTILKTSGGTTIQTTDAIYRGPGWSSSGYLTGPGVINTAANSVTILAGGLSSTTGGLIQLYGPSHATQANDIIFRSNGGLAVYQYDHDQNRQDWYAPANTLALRLTASALSPGASDLLALGTTALPWADLHGATGFTWNIGNGNVVWTHSSGIMTVSTGELRITTAGTNSASVVTVGGTQTLTNKTLTSPIIGTGMTLPTGSWTPQPQFGGANVSMTGTFSGSYTDVGNLCFARCSLTFTAKGVSTGTMTISGLPHTVGTGIGMIYSAGSNWSTIANVILADPQTGTTNAILKEGGASAPAVLTEGDVNNNTTLFICIVFTF